MDHLQAQVVRQNQPEDWKANASHARSMVVLFGALCMVAALVSLVLLTSLQPPIERTTNAIGVVAGVFSLICLIATIDYLVLWGASIILAELKGGSTS